jgi:fumarate reductase subunit C
VYWWAGQWRYLKFILRELSSVFVALTVIMTLFELSALRNGPDAYAHLQRALKMPVIVAVTVISLFFLVFHTITWFNLTPRALPIRLRGKRVPEWLVAAPNYAAWIVVSGVVVFVFLRS